MPHDRAMQELVVRTALSLFERDDLPLRVDVPISWPVEFKTAYRGWQPKEPAPIVAMLKRQVLERRATEQDPERWRPAKGHQTLDGSTDSPEECRESWM
jgi:hypothetical protein